LKNFDKRRTGLGRNRLFVPKKNTQTLLTSLLPGREIAQSKLNRSSEMDPDYATSREARKALQVIFAGVLQ
jgi:hypothetical protein